MPTVLITGGHKGLGLRAIGTIAATRRYDLVLAGRNLAEIEPIAADLRARFGVRATGLLMDTSSLDSVRRGAAAFRKMVADGLTGQLSTLMLNAGAQLMGKVQYSADGYEQTFAGNCLGHFLLVNLLIDDMADDGRVVFTASGTHDPATMDVKMVGAAVEPDARALASEGKYGKPISGGRRYATSKLCTILYAYELDRRLRARGSGIVSVAFDPGLVVETGLVRSAPAPVQWLLRTGMAKWLFRKLGVTMGSTGFSGDALARVAVDPAFAGTSGKYIQSNNGVLGEAHSSAVSYDKGKAHKLWVDSESLAGLGMTAARQSIASSSSLRSTVPRAA